MKDTFPNLGLSAIGTIKISEWEISNEIRTSAMTSLPPGFNSLCAFRKNKALSGKWLIASEIHTQSKLAWLGPSPKYSPIFSASSSTNFTLPEPRTIASPSASGADFPSAFAASPLNLRASSTMNSWSQILRLAERNRGIVDSHQSSALRLA